MKKIFSFLALASLVSITSCATDADQSPSAGDVVGESVTLFASTGSVNRVAMGDRDSNGIALDWDDDSFEVYDSTDTYVGTFSNDGEGGSEFTNDDVVMTEGETYTAYYPTKAAVLGTLTQSVNGEYADGMDDMILMEKEFVYEATGVSLAFDHKTTIFEFIFSTATYDYAPAKLVYNDGAGDEYTVVYSGEEAADDLYTLYTVVNPASGTRTMSVTITDTNYNTYVYTASPLDHVAGYVYTYTLTNSEIYSVATTPAGLVNMEFDSSSDISNWVITTYSSSSSKATLEATDEGLKVSYTATSGTIRADVRVTDVVVDPTTYPIFAIKTTLPTDVFRLHSNLGYFNNVSSGNYNYTGSYDSDGDGVDDVLYYNLEDGFGGTTLSSATEMSFLTWITTNNGYASDTSLPNYILIDWVKTYEKVEALKAEYPEADGGSTGGAVGLLDYTFDTADETYSWFAKSTASGASISATTTGLECTVNSSKRIDLYNNSGVTVDTSKYPILAIKVYNHTGASFRLHDTTLGSFNGITSGDNSTGTLSYDGSYEIKYFDLSDGGFSSDTSSTFNTSGEYTFASGSTSYGVGWVITQTNTTDALKVDWIKTFKSVDEIKSTYTGYTE